MCNINSISSRCVNRSQCAYVVVILYLFALTTCQTLSTEQLSFGPTAWTVMYGEPCNTSGLQCARGLACGDNQTCECVNSTSHFYSMQFNTCRPRIISSEICHLKSNGEPSDSCLQIRSGWENVDSSCKDTPSGKYETLLPFGTCVTQVTCKDHTCACANIETDAMYRILVSYICNAVIHENKYYYKGPLSKLTFTCVTGIRCSSVSLVDDSCFCPDNYKHYYNTASYQCLPRVPVNRSCDIVGVPLSSCQKGLVCVDHKCQCENSTFYFYNKQSQTCERRRSYGSICNIQEDGLPSNMCLSGLTCDGLECICPNVTDDSCLANNSFSLVQKDKYATNGTQLPVTGLAVGITSFIVFLFLVILFALHVLRRRKNLLAKLKVGAHWPKNVEEDNARMYDAFVSYVSEDWDTEFVLHTLMPTLEEKHQFRLCVHQRDFVPGQFITENIASAVKQSRRTILVITHAFLYSDWCRFEYQMALQEMLAEEHRLLPIIVGDMTDLKRHMPDSLALVMKSVTCLEYPGHDAPEWKLNSFWTRLVLSMPKKRRDSMSVTLNHLETSEHRNEYNTVL